MKEKADQEALKQRIRDGEVRRGDVVRRLAELAFGRANDCVRLALEEKPDIRRLDLSLLDEVKRSDRGAVEVKLADRLQALRQLAELVGEEDAEMEQFLRALQEGEDP